MLRTLLPPPRSQAPAWECLWRGEAKRTLCVPDGGKMMKMVFFLATNRDASRPALQSKATGIPNQEVGNEDA